MADDAAIRANRLALLKDIASTLRRFGDLDKIVRVQRVLGFSGDLPSPLKLEIVNPVT